MVTDHDAAEIDIRIDEGLWRSSMLPEGVLQHWLALDGAEVAAGQAVAVLLIEDAGHDLIAPVTGRLQIFMRANAVVEPGALVGRIMAPAPAR